MLLLLVGSGQVCSRYRCFCKKFSFIRGGVPGGARHQPRSDDGPRCCWGTGWRLKQSHHKRRPRRTLKGWWAGEAGQGSPPLPSGLSGPADILLPDQKILSFLSFGGQKGTDDMESWAARGHISLFFPLRSLTFSLSFYLTKVSFLPPALAASPELIPKGRARLQILVFS